MSITRITEGEHRTEIEGSWTVYTDEFEAYAGNISHFTAKNGTLIGNPEKAPEDLSDNAYLPVIIINESTEEYYDVQTLKSTWNLSNLVEPSLRKPFVKNVKFKTLDKIIPINFDVRKGNPTANDSDGGHITAISFNSKNENLGKVIFENLKYDDHFVFEWDKTKDIAQVDFYADDNDSFFDGGVENVFCGAVKYKKSRIWEIWEAYPKGDQITRDELFEKVGGYLKRWYDEIKALPKNDKRYISLDNTCALRMSWALNHSNNLVPEKNESAYKTFKGRNNLNYFITVDNIRKYLLETISKQPIKVNRLTEHEVLFIETECGWDDATGNVDIMVDRVYGTDYHLECQTVVGWTDID